MNLFQNCIILVILFFVNSSMAKKNEFKTKQISVDGNVKKMFYPKLSTTGKIVTNVENTEDSVISLVRNRHRRSINDNVIWASTEYPSDSSLTTSKSIEKRREPTNTRANVPDDKVPRVVQEDFIRNCSGEYKFEFRMSDGTRRAEVGEFEERNGRRVFVIRGIFAYLNENKEYKIKAYIVDDLGYHNVAIPFIASPEGVTDFRPDIDGSLCDPKLGEYCIDTKLLTIMVG